MRRTILSAAIVAGLSLTSVTAHAGPVQATTPSHTQTADIDELKAEIAALQQKVANLESRSDAQAQAQHQTAQQVQATEARVAAANPLALASAGKSGHDKTIAYKGVNITLGGFLAAESIYRTRNEGADIASNYNGIPFDNVHTAHTNEFRYSSRQSRFSLLAQGDVNENTRVSGYYEMDLMGGAQTANQNETNSFNPRIRNLYATVDWDNPGLHLLAGQSWSLVTLNSVGMTPRTELPPPSIDLQFVPGFVWARQTQIRLVKDWNKTTWLGISLENPQTTFYSGPNAATAPVQPVYNIAAGSGYDSANTLSLNHLPDVVVKLAVDPGFGHYELFALGRSFYSRYGGSNHDAYGGGVGVGMILPVIPKTLDFQFSGMSGKGIGRYGSAQLPDVTFNPNGSTSPIKQHMLLAGLTLHAGSDLDVYAFGGREQSQKAAFDYNNIPYGYGNPFYVNSGCSIEGASSALCTGNTKDIWQATAGFWWRFYQGSFGKVQFGAQYSHTERTAFAGVGGAPSTNDNMFFTSLRYYPF